MSKYTENEIINSIKNGNNSEVFLYFYEKIFPKVRNYILKNGGDKDEAKDIFQDALLLFVNKVKLAQYEHRTEIDGFIFAVARNIWINRTKVMKRKSDVRPEEMEVAGDVDLEKILIIKERKNSLTSLLEDLGDRCKELLIFTYYHKLSMKEIAEKMGFSNDNTAKTKNYKCKQRLIKKIEDNKELSILLK